MATKRSTPLDDPPSASSDDEETEEEQEQEHDREESEEEETINPVKNPLEKPKIEKPSSRTVESSSEEDSESESEKEIVKASIETSKTLNHKSSSISESEPDFGSPTASAFTIKPSKKIAVHATPEKPANSKRPSSGSDPNSQKKIKVSNGDIDDEKKSVIKRVWNDDDELMLLQGFIDYQSDKQCSPLSDIDDFYRFIMDSLPGNASKSQVYEKIRRLKKKFFDNSEKTSGTSDDPVFSKPHDHKLFELSKKIWGNGGTERSKIKQKTEVKEDEEDEIDDFETLYPNWNAGLKSSSLSFPEGVISFVKKNLSLIGEDKAKEMEEKWKAHFENETLLKVRRVALLGKVGELVEASLETALME